MRLFILLCALLGGCQCLATPGVTGPVAPFVPGAPSLPQPFTAAAPLPLVIQVPVVTIVPGAVSMGGGVPTVLPGGGLTPVVEPPPPLPPPPDPRTRRPHHPPPPPVTADPPPPVTAEPDTGLTAAQIRAVVGAASARVQRCYEPRLANDPNLRGRVVIGMTIAADGSVSSSDVRESFDPEIGGCVANIMSGLRFPETPSGGTASIPFVFSPPSAPGDPPPGDPASANPGQI